MSARVKYTYRDTLELVDQNRIWPIRCYNCKTTLATAGSWNSGQDDHRDRDYVGFQCQNCGAIDGLTRRTILARLRAINARRDL